ncbi:alpha/beta fold hydrolase [Phenylobacterium sp.]|uniref:alpha/beta fold hydrolase n=1 Tax=Phenylobacterium sp. TaxID=1871053 RepID=UPI002FC63017
MTIKTTGKTPLAISRRATRRTPAQGARVAPTVAAAVTAPTAAQPSPADPPPLAAGIPGLGGPAYTPAFVPHGYPEKTADLGEAPLNYVVAGPPSKPSQSIKEYDPEWARAFYEGTVAASCPHDLMLAKVKVPVLLTHHSRTVDEATGHLAGALTDLQARQAGGIVKKAGQRFDYVSLPDAAHAMHAAQPERFATVVRDWAGTLPA